MQNQIDPITLVNKLEEEISIRVKALCVERGVDKLLAFNLLVHIGDVFENLRTVIGSIQLHTEKTKGGFDA